ncbi:sulfurtransferase [Halothiobacillus sp. DCM-1]|uniref:sulfurtransferase n=1 Tax=Halothiobacillus sp. DCM-1 TaxID=3112558 RepID=UPI0032459DCF
MIKFISAAQACAERDAQAPWRVLDLSSAAEALAGSHRVQFDAIVRNEGDTVGLLPAIEALNQALAHTGMTRQTPVLLIDDQQGLAASRLAWTLAVCGFDDLWMVDGGRAALIAARWPLGEPAAAEATPVLAYDLTVHHCTAEVIRDHLNHPDWQILDARSRAEYDGTDQRARNAGHIPGAIHCDWRDLFRPEAPDFLRPEAEIRALLAERGVMPDRGQTLAVYCQSHRRSSLLFAVLKHLGFGDVRGYPGAWSDWGNRDDVPIARPEPSVTPTR